VSFTIDNSRVHWAGLVKAGGEVVFLRYGSGASTESAATYALERWSKGEEDRPTVGGQLRALGVKRGILLVLADEGLLELRCTVKPCYCPYGDDYFDFKLHPPGPWAATDGHHQVRRMDGGERTRDNTTLEHTRCNNLDHKRIETPVDQQAEGVAKWLGQVTNP